MSLVSARLMSPSPIVTLVTTDQLRMWPCVSIIKCATIPTVPDPGLFLADSSEASRMGIENICSFRLSIQWTSARHLKMLMTDIASLPLSEEEENVSRSLKKLKSWLIGHLSLCCLWIPDNYWIQIRCHEDIVTSEETTVSPLSHITPDTHTSLSRCRAQVTPSSSSSFLILTFLKFKIQKNTWRRKKQFWFQKLPCKTAVQKS